MKENLSTSFFIICLIQYSFQLIIHCTFVADILVCLVLNEYLAAGFLVYSCCPHMTPLSSTWPHLNSDVGLEKGEY